ncbi:MAG TPA: PspC domain-containing protein [Chitinophagaceae bacterium]|nr:PspC domain-containing protein [Chitinophagaceae bacterium]
MKKVININFQGRVIPIEETAYEILQQYIESLRKYFAKEEGRDEIINDIEGRIAELFSDKLKQGSTCITDENVLAVIASMGRPEDFEQAEEAPGATFQQQSSYQQTNASQQQYTEGIPEPRRLYRSEADKVLGGVCAGLANYLKIDPAVVRIIFALITLGGFGLGVLLYILMWIFLPSKNLVSASRKRLYRNPDDKVLGGVASGLAAYFKIEVWILRLIFALPLILSIIVSLFRNAWFDWEPGPIFVTGGFGGTLFITYIILWIVLPEAVTASEKLEMRGEKVDLESIKNTVKGGLQNLKSRTEQWAQEVKQTAEHYTKSAGPRAQAFAAEAGPVVRKTGTGIGHAIGVLFKAFFLFIAGMIAFALLMALIGLLLGGFAFFPFKNFLLDGLWQNFFAWSMLIFFLGIPIVAFLVWLIRRIIGVKTKNHYLGYIFGTLWVYGLVSLIILVGMVSRNFRSKASVKSDFTISQPVNNKVYLKVTAESVKYYGDAWWGYENGEWPFYSITEDSISMNTVRIQIVKSADSAYHVYQVKLSNGRNPSVAQNLASQIRFDIQQRDSMIFLPRGFTINKDQKFRNQQVLLVVEVPVGKKIEIDRNVSQYQWFDINFNRRRTHVDWYYNLDNTYWYDEGVEYIMLQDGLRSTRRIQEEKEQAIEEDAEKKEVKEVQKKSDGYRYKGKDSTNQKATDAPDSTQQPKAISQADEEEKVEEPYPSVMYMLMRIAK